MAAGVDVTEIGAPDQLRACSNAGPFSYPVCAEFVPPAGSSTSRRAHRPHDFRGPSYRCIACTLGKPPFRDAVNKRATDRGPSAFGHKRASGTQARSSRSSRVVEHDPALCQLAKQYRDIVRDIIEVHADDSHLLGYQEISDGVVDEDALGRLDAS